MTEPFDPVRFAKICEMLRSDNPNERAIAGERATTMLQHAGLTWTSFIGAASLPTSPKAPQSPSYRAHSAAPQSQPQPQAQAQPSWQRDRPRTTVRNGRTAADIIAELMKRVDTFPNWEQAFLKTIVHQHHYGLTEGQWKSVEQMLAMKKRRTSAAPKVRKTPPRKPAKPS